MCFGLGMWRWHPRDSTSVWSNWNLVFKVPLQAGTLLTLNLEHELAG